MSHEKADPVAGAIHELDTLDGLWVTDRSDAIPENHDQRMLFWRLSTVALADRLRSNIAERQAEVEAARLVLREHPMRDHDYKGDGTGYWCLGCDKPWGRPEQGCSAVRLARLVLAANKLAPTKAIARAVEAAHREGYQQALNDVEAVTEGWEYRASVYSALDQAQGLEDERKRATAPQRDTQPEQAGEG